jgi:hypothetical protein
MTSVQRLSLIAVVLFSATLAPVAQESAGEPATDVPAAEAPAADAPENEAPDNEAPADDVLVEVTRGDPGPDGAGAENTPDAEEPGEDRVLETDDESYLDIDEEDFTPSEEIPTDQSISFPIDI